MPVFAASALRVGLVILTSAALFAQQGPGAEALRDEAPSTATISGIVVSDDAPARPLVGAEVILRTESDSNRGKTTTDAAGAFTFSAVAAGRYRLVASQAGFVRMAYGAKRFDRPGVPVAVATGRRVSGLTIVLPRGAAISGVVRGADGQPTAKVRVTAMQRVVEAGERVLLPSLAWRIGATIGADTNERGEYRLTDLPPASYRIQAFLEGQVVSPRVLFQPPVFYPDALDEANAAVIDLASGDDRQDVNIGLRGVATASVSGTLVNSLFSQRQLNSTGTVSVRLPPRLQLMPGGGEAIPDAQGRFVFERVSPGSYTIDAGLFVGPVRQSVEPGPDGSPMTISREPDPSTAAWARADVRVDGADISGVMVQARPTTSIRGRVVLENQARGALDLASVGITLAAVAPWQTYKTLAAKATADGRFAIDRVAPGRHYLLASTPSGLGSAPPWTVQSIVVRGREVADVAFDVAPDEPLTDVVITLTNRTPTVSGTILDDAGQPRLDVTLFIFAVDRRFWEPFSRRVRLARPATDGSFDVPDLPAGDYHVAAFRDVEPDDPTDSKFLDALVAGAMTLTLAPGEHKVQNLRVAEK